MVESAQRTTLQERVYAGIQADIFEGRLAPGAHLRVAHLAEQFGTSQAPVREALRRLTEEGLAITKPFVGTVVSEPTWSDIEDIYLLREELEAFAVRRIMGNPTVTLAPVWKAFDDLVRVTKSGDEMQVLDADLALHHAICAAAASKLTLEVWLMITKRFRGARLTLSRRHPDDMATVVRTHRALIAALEGGDAELAEKVIREHISSALAAYAAARAGADAETANGRHGSASDAPPPQRTPGARELPRLSPGRPEARRLSGRGGRGAAAGRGV